MGSSGKHKRELEESKEEVKTLHATLSLVKKDLENYRIEAAALKTRIDDLNHVKAAAEGRTIAEAEAIFLKSMNEKIDRNADEKLTILKDDWAKKEKPKEVKAEATCQLKQVIEILRKPPPKYFSMPVMEAGIPQMVEEMLEEEHKRRLNEDFEMKVEAESEKRALQKLRQKVKVEWPNYVNPIVSDLRVLAETQILKLLQGPWDITCNKCVQAMRFIFNSANVATLIHDKSITLGCVNPNCKDLTFLPHVMRVSLEFLISTRLPQPVS